MKGPASIAYKLIAVIYVPMLLLLAFIPQATDGGTSYALNLLFFFLYSFPFYCVYLEIGATVRDACERRATPHLGRALHAIRLALSIGMLLTLIDIKEGLKFALVMAVVWCLLMVLDLAVFRRV